MTGLCQWLHGVGRPIAGMAVVVVRWRAVRRVVGVVTVVLMVRVVVGVWPAALVGGAMVTACAAAALAAIDPRPTDRRSIVRIPARPADATACGPGPVRGLEGRHLEFARGLAGVAEWYLAECEREVQR
jgi:hypothetical protein